MTTNAAIKIELYFSLTPPIELYLEGLDVACPKIKTFLLILR